MSGMASVNAMNVSMDIVGPDRRCGSDISSGAAHTFPSISELDVCGFLTCSEGFDEPHTIRADPPCKGEAET